MPLPLLPFLDVAGRVLDRILPDKAAADKAKAELALELQREDVQLALAQIDVNKVEAASSDKFTSRARPFILYVCGVAFAYHFVLQPLLAFCIVNMGYQLTLPDFDMESLSTVLYSILGLGGMRSVERLAGKVK